MPFDNTTPLPPAIALLRAARERIADPANWVKHAPTASDEETGRYCAMSAVPWSDAFDALNALSRSLPGDRWHGRVWTFNDAPTTTHADIMAMFDRAERLLWG